jgi:hypothetical protein
MEDLKLEEENGDDVESKLEDENGDDEDAKVEVAEEEDPKLGDPKLDDPKPNGDDENIAKTSIRSCLSKSESE